MITGFNTDIEHDGVIYHVQTEDKGLDSPLILSLVYSGGAILASKRSPYEDLIATGFDEEALAQRLKRQHRLICAAINAGRIEDLKRMGRPDAADKPPVAEEVAEEAQETVQTTAEGQSAKEVAETVEAVADVTTEFELGTELEATEPAPEQPAEPPDGEIINVPLHELIVTNASDYAAIAEVAPQPPPAAEEPETPMIVVPAPVHHESPYTVHDSRRQTPVTAIPKERGVMISILDEEDFRAGQIFNIRVLVEHRTESGGRALVGVPLSVKILGTTFRPQLYSVKTGKDGVAVISAQIPRFTSGRAAILIRADAEGKAVETRRVIHAAL